MLNVGFFLNVSVSVVSPFVIRSDEGLKLEKSAFLIFHRSNSTLINSFYKTRFFIKLDVSLVQRHFGGVREKRGTVVILVQGFAKMLWCQNKSRTW